MNISTSTTTIRVSMLLILALASSGGFPTLASGTDRLEAESEAKSTDHYSGTVRGLDISQRSLRVKGFWSTRTFELAETCRVSLEDQPEASLDDLALGHRVDVDYRNHDGVRVATRVTQRNLEFEGHVSALDETAGTFRVKRGLVSRRFSAAMEPGAEQADASEGGTQDLELGEKIRVIYLAEDGVNRVQRIERRGLEFKGRVESLDSRAGAIGAGSLLAHRRFRLGDDCQIVVRGELGAELEDLRIGQTVTIRYEDVEGVLVANRIELQEAREEPTQEQFTRRDTPEP
jgi:hypothetical protein